MVVVELSVVDRRSSVADIVHVDVTGVQAVELGNHFLLSLLFRFWSAYLRR